MYKLFIWFELLLAWRLGSEWNFLESYKPRRNYIISSALASDIITWPETVVINAPKFTRKGPIFKTAIYWVGQKVHLVLSAAVQSLSCVWLFVTPWRAAHQASLSFTIFWSLLKLTSIESVMPPSHLILYCLLLLLPLIFPSIRVFSNNNVLSVTLQ